MSERRTPGEFDGQRRVESAPVRFREWKRSAVGDLGEIIIMESLAPRYQMVHKFILESPDKQKRIDFGDVQSLFDAEVAITFKKDYGWYAVEPPASQVLFPSTGLFEDPRDVLVLLHEIGHITAVAKGGVRTPTFPDSDTKADQIAWRSSTVQTERNAWAEALRAVRRIKRQHGIDLLTLFEGREELEAWIRSGQLETYESKLEELGVPAFSKRGVVERYQNRKP